MPTDGDTSLCAIGSVGVCHKVIGLRMGNKEPTRSIEPRSPDRISAKRGLDDALEGTGPRGAIMNHEHAQRQRRRIQPCCVPRCRPCKLDGIVGGESLLSKRDTIAALLLIMLGSVCIEAAVRGLGVARVPLLACAAEIEAGTLVEVLAQWRNAAAPIHAVYASTSATNPTLKAFLDALHAAAERAWWLRL